MSVFTFGYGLTSPSSQLYQFGIGDTTVRDGDIFNQLDDLKQYLTDHGESVRWGIGQSSGAWYGFGIDNFAYALDQQEQRYARDSIQNSHGNETASIICDMLGGGKLVISAQPIVDGNLTNRFRIECLTKGIPMDIEPYQRIADIFDGSLGNATVAEIEKYELNTLNVRINAENVANRITEEDTYETWVTNPIVKNPTVKNERLVNNLNASREEKESAQLALQAAEYVVTHGHHARSTDVDYHVQRMTVENLSTTTGFNFYNYDINAHYIEE